MRNTISEVHEYEIWALDNVVILILSSSSSKATLLPAEAHRSYRHIHGMCKLPRGYSLTWLPSNARIISDVGDKPGDLELCSSYNVPKAIIAIIQTIYASITLYRARGDQIQRYGYAAFGLTVLPYLIMSIMNLLATSLLPDYSTLYIVRSLELDEAITAGAQVDGAVGRIVQSAIEDDMFLASNAHKFCLCITHAHSKIEVPCYPPIPFEKVTAERWTLKYGHIDILAIYVFGAILGIWTHFHAGKSTIAQRVWTIMWLVMDICYGPLFDKIFEIYHLFGFQQHYWELSTAFVTVSAIGGFVVVGQMLRAYGTCVQVEGVNT